MLLFILAILVTLFVIVFNTIKDIDHVPKVSVTIAGLILAVILFAMSVTTYIPTGYTGIVTTFGKVHDETLDAGISLKRPWDSVIRMDNREQRRGFVLEAFSKDIQETIIEGSINFNIDKSTAMNLYREVGVNYLDILIVPRILEDVKAVVSQYTAEELIANRSALSESIREQLSNDLKPNGINVITIAIENIDFTDAFTNAVEAKQVATQDKQKAQTQEEQKTMEAEQAAKRKKIEAEANADVLRTQADAEAYSIEAKANSEAEANKKINESLTDELIRYNQAKNWDGKLPSTYIGGDGNEPLPVIEIPIDENPFEFE